jgi:hypothetical protein
LAATAANVSARLALHENQDHSIEQGYNQSIDVVSPARGLLDRWPMQTLLRDRESQQSEGFKANSDVGSTPDQSVPAEREARGAHTGSPAFPRANRRRVVEQPVFFLLLAQARELGVEGVIGRHERFLAVVDAEWSPWPIQAIPAIPSAMVIRDGWQRLTAQS